MQQASKKLDVFQRSLPAPPASPSAIAGMALTEGIDGNYRWRLLTATINDTINDEITNSNDEIDMMVWNHPWNWMLCAISVVWLCRIPRDDFAVTFDMGAIHDARLRSRYWWHLPWHWRAIQILFSWYDVFCWCFCQRLGYAGTAGRTSGETALLCSCQESLVRHNTPLVWLETPWSFQASRRACSIS